jgi:hypothetical protein
MIVDAPDSAAELQAVIRRVAQAGRLKSLVLIGDVPRAAGNASTGGRASVPTNYVPAKINTRWGSEPTIATDIPYADIDGDATPDLAVGRIPADSPDELAAVIRKVIRYERQATDLACGKRLNVVAGAGGFGAVTDAIIEAAGRQVMQQVVPADYEVEHLSAKSNPAMPADLRESVRRQLSEGALAWIYLGHGLPTELDRTRTPAGNAPILSVDDVASLRCGEQSPLAVMIACYTGAMDSPRDCLAEELTLAEDGPIAVMAATRVTMPYGNTVLGYELLRACFQDRPAALGEVLQRAQRRTLQDSATDAMRPSLDSLAQGLSPPPVDLAAERREHVWMYHLFGDPLLRLHAPPSEIARSGPGDSTVK